MALTTELRTKLLDKDEPPLKRIRLAHKVFISQQLRVERKEEVALESVCILLSTEESNTETWEILLECLRSPRMQHMHGVDIQPAIKKMLITLLKTTLVSTSESEALKSVVSECAIAVLQAPCMEQYLSRKSKEFIELCANIIAYLSNLKPSPIEIKMAKQVVEIILSYHRKQPQELNFRIKFLSNLLLPLIELESKWSNKIYVEVDIKEFSAETNKLIQIMAITKQHQEIYESILNYVLGITSYTEYSNDPLLVQVHKCAIVYDSQGTCTSNLVSKIVSAFATNYKKSDLVVKMLVILCYIVGLRPDYGNESPIVDEKRLKEILNNENLIPTEEIQRDALRAIREMLYVLANEEIVFEECSFGIETGREWLVRLSTHILNTCPKRYTMDAIYAIIPVVKIDLLMIETLLPDITLLISSMPYAKIAFHLLISESLQVAEKQQRGNKLIAKLLDGIKLAKNAKSESINALIPDKFLEELKNCCTLMHSKHVANLISSILFHLEEGCIVSLETTRRPGASELAYLQVVSCLLYSVLMASRCAQHTTAAPVLEKFCSQLKSLATLLKRLEKVFWKKGEKSEILESMLLMSVGWGEIYLLLLHYVGTEACSINPPKKMWEDQNPYNLSMLHSHIPEKHWIAFSKSTSKDEVCSKLMVDLVAQKFRACVLLNLPDSNTSLCNMAEVLVTEGTPGPLYPSLGLLIPLLLNDNGKDNFAKTMASDLLCNGPWCQMLQHPLDQNCDKFIGSVALEILTLMSKKGFGCISTVLEPLNMKNIESEQLEAMATKLCDELTSSFPTLSYDDIEAYLLSLDKLPLKQMPKSVRCACALAILASCVSLNKSWILPAQLLIKLLGSTGKETPLPSSMNYGELIHWMINLIKEDYIESPKLMSTLVSALLGNLTSSPETLSKGLKSVKKALKSYPSTITAKVCNFLLPYMHNRVQSKESKNYDMFKKYEQDLSYLVLTCLLKHKNNSILPSLSIALLSVDHSDLVDQVLDLLPDLLSDLLPHYHTDSVVAILECLVALPEASREKIMPHMWQYLCLLPDLSSVGYNCLQKLLSTASDEQKESVVDILLCYEMEVGFCIWKLLIQMCSGEKKEQKWMRKMQSNLRLSMLRWEVSNESLINKILPSVDLLIALTKSKVELEPTMLDLILDSVLALQLDKRDVRGIVSLLRSAISLLNALLTSRGVLLLERIPVFQQRLAVLLTTLARSAPPTIHSELANQLAVCAHAIEGIGVGIHLYKKDFARVASYMVADVLHLFEHHNIHHSVKTHLEKYLHALLRLCDEHAEHFLLGVLSPASQQLLRSELKHSKKEKQIKV